MIKKILVTGGNGFIGSHLISILQTQGYEVANIDIIGKCDFLNGDISNYETIYQAINIFKPQVVIHCAARKNLPDCEQHKRESFQSNVLSTENLVLIAKYFHLKLIYLSSDVIFDGEHGNYSINTKPNPINWYGKTKCFSEFLVGCVSDFAICRTALVIGRLNRSYCAQLKHEVVEPILINQTLLPQYIYLRLRKGLPVELPSQYISNPTPIELLGEFILKIIKNNKVGIFHTSGPTSVSRVDIANMIADNFGLDRLLIKTNNTYISNLRPKNISLDVTSTFAELQMEQLKWDLKKYLCNRSLYNNE